MNNLASRQNQADILDMLAAQRQLYLEAKSIVKWRTVVVILLASIPIITHFIHGLEELEWTTLIPLVFVSFIFPIALKRWEKSKVLLAASIQEKIDTTLFDLPWTTHVAIGKPIDLQITSAAARFRGDRALLNDWYSNIPDTLEHATAVLRCQQINLWWDSEQRHFFMRMYQVLGISAYLIPLIWAGFAGTPVAEYAFYWLVPSFGLIELCFEKFNAHNRLSQKQTQLAAEINELLESNANVNTQLLRANQDVILQNRMEPALVPEWIYNRLRPRLESAMKHSNEKS